MEMFDTLMYVKRLEAVGISREQAETQVQIMAEVIDTNLTTKQDLKDLRRAMGQDFKDVRAEMDRGFKDVHTEMNTRFKDAHTEMHRGFSDVDQRFLLVKKDMVQLEYRIVIKLGALITAGVAVLAAMKFF
jgi:hypothetical protein